MGLGGLCLPLPPSFGSKGFKVSSRKKKYGLKTDSWSKELFSRFTSLEAYCGAAGFKLRNVAKTPEQFISVVCFVYQTGPIQADDFEQKILALQSQISGMSMTERRGHQRRIRELINRFGVESLKEKAMPTAELKLVASPTPPREIKKRSNPKKKSKRKTGGSKADREAFYRSWDWRTLRMEVLQKYGRTCMCCGARPTDKDMAGKPVRIVVDHIYPLSTHWELRLVRSNLQVLCDECNQGKGSWDKTDYRPFHDETDEGEDPEDPVVVQLRYSV